MTPQTEDVEEVEETDGGKVWSYALVRPPKDAGVKVAGGYKIDESLFNGNGGIIAADQSEAERVAKLTGWETRPIQLDKGEVPNRPILPKEHRTMAHSYHGLSEQEGIRQFLSSIEYYDLKKFARKLRDNGAPHIDLNASAPDLKEYVINNFEDYGNL